MSVNLRFWRKQDRFRPYVVSAVDEGQGEGGVGAIVMDENDNIAFAAEEDESRSVLCEDMFNFFEAAKNYVRCEVNRAAHKFCEKK